MKQIMAEYIKYIKNKNLSNNTLEAYVRDITNFMEFLEERDENFGDVDSTIITVYTSKLKKEGKADSSIIRTLSTLKGLFKFMIVNGYASEDPLISYEVPKSKRNVPKILSVEEVEKLLNAPDVLTNKGKRDKAMLEIMYACGLKISELLDLKIFNVNLEMKYVKCKGSKNSERIIPIGSYAVKCINNYLQVRDDLNYEKLDYLFFNNKGRRMSRQGFWKIIKAYAEDACIDKNINSYTLRHSFAVHLLQNGANLTAVQRMLGHRNVSATQIYSEAVDDIKLLDVYKNAHPRA